MRSKVTPAASGDHDPWELDAGPFSAWLRHARKALHSGMGTDVACGECVGCCSSSYFIHVKAEEREALRAIPREVLFPAPGLPKGHGVMGYDKNGLCPMLVQGKCSIYDHRPQTCRNYDCRIFAAAGIAAGGDEKDVINRRVSGWRFSYPAILDRDEHEAVRAAAAFIQRHGNCFPGGRVPGDPSQLAILAIKVYAVFLQRGGVEGGTGRRLSPVEIANAVVEASRKFDGKKADDGAQFSGTVSNKEMDPEKRLR